MPTVTQMPQDTIAAQATAPGRGSIGIIRVSGPAVAKVVQCLVQVELRPRYAYYGMFYDGQGEVLDEGIALYFPAPHSFTGEDILELHGHGGPVVLDVLLKSILALGVRLARPGEFSERAFLNDKMDLAQAEAVADLINSTSAQAAKAAVRSLQGAFSQQINALVTALIDLRTYVEAAIDFPDEEVDFLTDGHVAKRLAVLIQQVDQVVSTAQQGALLSDGMTVVIAGRPNAGKSSLLNGLAGRETAIVTDIAGTTRDVLREHIHLDGMPLHLIDTAGLRPTDNPVEAIGVDRAVAAIKDADRVLLLVDSTATATTAQAVSWLATLAPPVPADKITLVRNKIDLTGEPPGLVEQGGIPIVRISAISGLGLADLKAHLKACMGFVGVAEGGGITARRRHLAALVNAREQLGHGQAQLEQQGAGELLAEDLRGAQNALSEITGTFSNEALLSRIFSSFCIGK